MLSKPSKASGALDKASPRAEIEAMIEPYLFYLEVATVTRPPADPIGLRKAKGELVLIISLKSAVLERAREKLLALADQYKLPLLILEIKDEPSPDPI